MSNDNQNDSPAGREPLPPFQRPPAAPGAPPTPRPLGRRNKLKPFVGYELPSVSQRRFALETVDSAANQAAMGFMASLGELAQRMLTDDAFSAAAEKRILGLLRNRSRIEPCSPSKRDKEVAEAIERFLPTMLPEEKLRRWVMWWHLTGFSCASVSYAAVFDPTRAWSVPCIDEALNTKWFYYDVGRSCWVFISADGVLFDIDSTNGRWMTVQTWRPGDLAAGKASQLAKAWVNKAFALDDIAAWSDWAAWPVLKATTPMGGNINDPSDPQAQQAQAFVDDLQQSVRERVVGVQKGEPGMQGFDFEVVQVASGESWKVFPWRIEYFDRKIQVSWLGGNVGSEVVDQASKAVAGTQDTAEQKLIMSDAVLIASRITDCLIRFFVDVNFGPNTSCPKLVYDVGADAEQARLAAGLSDFAQFVKDLPPGIKVRNLKELAMRFGVELDEDVEERALLVRQEVVDASGDPQNDLDKKNKETPSKREKTPRAIKKVGDGRWRVFNRSGERVGTYSSLAEAKERLLLLNE